VDPLADIHPGESLNQLSFDRHGEEPDPCSLWRSAGHNGVELFSDPRLEQERGGRFGDLSFHLVGSIFLFRAMESKFFQLVGGIGGRSLLDGRLQ